MNTPQLSSLRNLQVEAARLQDENHLLREELDALRTSLRALGQLGQVTARITPAVDARELVREILRSALAVIKASEGSLLLQDDESGELVFAMVIAEDDRARGLMGYRLPAGMGIAGWVAEHRAAQVVRDVRLDYRFYPLVDEAFDYRTRSLVAVPLVVQERVIGVIEVVNKVSDQDFSEDDLDLLTIVAQLASIALARADA